MHPLNKLTLAALLACPVYSAGDQLEEIIISAQSFDRDRGSTHSISTIDEDTLHTIQADHGAQALWASTNTWMTRGSGQESLLAIRSPVFTGPGSCAAFEIVQDDIPTRANSFCNVNEFFDSHFEVAQSISVLRGPQAKPHASASFGSIHVILPGVRSLEKNEFNVERGNYGFSKAIGQNIFTLGSYDAAVWYNLSEDGGFRDSAGYRQEKLSFRAEQLKNSIWGFDASNLRQETAGFIQGDDAYRDRELSRSNPTPDAYRDSSSFRVFNKTNKELSGGSLNSTTYTRWNDMEFLMHFLPWQPVELNSHYSLGNMTNVIFGNPKLQHELGLAIDLTRGTLEETQDDVAPFDQPSFPVGTHYDYTVDNYNLGLSAKSRWQANDKLSIDLALIADAIYLDYSTHEEAGSDCLPSTSSCRFYRPESSRETFSFLSTGISSTYKTGRSGSAFFKASKGYRAPQANELFRLQSAEQSETENIQLLSTEIGWKTSVNKQQFLQISIFQMQQNDGIVQDSNRNFINSADTLHRGLELETHYKLGKHWVFSGNYSYSEHTYENEPQQLGTSENIRGNFIDTAPRQLFSSRLTWEPAEYFSASLESVYLGDYYTDAENTERYPGHRLWNFYSDWQLNKQLRFKLKITNIADRLYAERADLAFGNERYFPGEPRRISLGLALDY